jgi:polyisoprenoid-binding protein YceI
MGWNVDKAHTQDSISVRHLGVSFIRGDMKVADASLNIDEANPEQSSIVATIDVASLSTGEPGRDGHLKAGDFFDVETYPHITFVSKKVSPGQGGKLDVVGDLTIKDVTNEVQLTGEHAGPVSDPVSSKRKMGFGLQGQIKRSDWGINWNVPMSEGGFMLSDTLTLNISAQAIEA